MGAYQRNADVFCYGVVILGMVNGVLQSTYVLPNSAITHLVCLGYLAVRYYEPVINTIPREHNIGYKADSRFH